MREIHLSPLSAVAPEALHLGSPQQEENDITLQLFSPKDVLEDFEARFPKVFELFARVGIHPTKALPVMNPYTGEIETEDFTNIGEHCVAVAYAASKIMEALVQADVVEQSDADYVIERALVHDLNKPYEIMRRKAMGPDVPKEVYSESAYEKLEPLLLEMGISEEMVAYLVTAGKETGHNSLKDFIALGEGGVTGIVEGRIAEKVVHLADDMTFTSTPTKEGQEPVTAFLTPKERIYASGFIEKYLWMWKEGLGVDESGTICEVADVNSPEDGITPLGNYANLQVQVAQAIARELMLNLGVTNRNPAIFIRDLIRGENQPIQ
ncbi:MAG: hypothetical protein KDD55_12220 [Bdellovibrionales bacterium]|nr:hypothetical protein [Bdellovibrionales bacterium]